MYWQFTAEFPLCGPLFVCCGPGGVFCWVLKGMPPPIPKGTIMVSVSAAPGAETGLAFVPAYPPPPPLQAMGESVCV